MLCPLPPFYSVLDPTLWDDATHFQDVTFLLCKNLSGHIVIDTLRDVFLW